MNTNLRNVTVSDARAIEILKFFLPEASFVYSENALITIREDNLEKEEFSLKISDKIIIKHSGYLSLRNALATLCEKATINGDTLTFEEIEITDKPHCSYRSVMLDLARGIRPFEELKNHVILIAKAKFNRLHLHLFDSEGICFQAKSFPKSAYLKNAYTIEQMQELNSLAKLLGLEIIPEVDMPAHSTKIIEAMPHFACKCDNITSFWTVCAGADGIFDFYDSVIAEVCSIFESRYFHIGGDELDFADVPHINQLCYWDKCEKCASVMKENNLSDRQELYYYFINNIYNIVKKYNRKMIMWSDQLDCARPPVIPTDVIMQFWRIAIKGRGPYENCSMNNQLKMGYELINSFYPQTYFDIDRYMTSESLKTFDYKSFPENNFPEKIIGSEICAWEYGNKEYSHYNTSLPFAVFLFGDKLWSGKELNYTDDYKRFITRCVLGASTPKDLDLSLIYCDILPPRFFDQGAFDYSKITTPISKLKEIKSTLESLNSPFATYYIDALNTVLQHIVC